jgi:hypothetical protein
MKKLLAIVMFSLLATQAIAADPAVVLPPSPVVPAIPADTPNEVTSAAETSTNKVYIDQSGGNPDINITQTGSSNVLGVGSNYFKLRGDNQTLVSIQTGNNNSIYGSIYGATVGINTTIQQLGNSNYLDFNCGAGTNANCDSSVFNWRFTGNNNTMYYNGGGTNQNSGIDVTGDHNYFNFNVQAPKATQNLNVTGDYNTFNVTQLNGGASGHSIAVDLIGTHNDFTMSQTGTVDNVINIKSVSNNGSFVVRQTN